MKGLLNSDIPGDSILVVTSEESRFLARDQGQDIFPQGVSILCEPEGRNTAPALTVAALSLLKADLDLVMVVCPSDHSILNESMFLETIKVAINSAVGGSIVTLGVSPSEGNTGYGYIYCPDPKPNAVSNVAAFVEKPAKEEARHFVQSGQYFWNCGILVVKPSTWMKAMENCRPDILDACKKSWASRVQRSKFIHFQKDDYCAIPSESIDYAVLEKCVAGELNLKMATADFGWSDLGTWDSLGELFTKNDRGNVIRGSGFLDESLDTLVYSTNRLVVGVGVKDLAIVEMSDVVLVVDKKKSHDMKKVLEKLKAKHSEEIDSPPKELRPWGYFENISVGVGYKVKKIVVKAGLSLSLQKHRYRSEHWTVVSGAVEVTRGNETLLLNVNESAFIPADCRHRLKNIGDKDAEVIEVQVGSYLGEDDIVRFDDDFGRETI